MSYKAESADTVKQNIQKTEYWLDGIIKQTNPKWDPERAMQSSINWMRALRYEIAQEHGYTSKEQFCSCQQHFADKVEKKHIKTQLANIWGPLFHSLTFCLSIGSLFEKDATSPWMLPSGIIMNYYASFNAIISILTAQNGDFKGDTHSKVINGLGTIRNLLPHPLNMVAERQEGEIYIPLLPNYPDAVKSKLEASFSDTREDAQGKILSYIKGTADWKSKEIKDNLRRKYRIDNFKSKANQELRNERLHSEINYLNCAFRYRGKANYRDSMFLAYGRKHSWLNAQFVDDLRIVATFCFICALAYVHRRLGEENVRLFLKDIEDHLRGSDVASGSELFWKDLAACI